MAVGMSTGVKKHLDGIREAQKSFEGNKVLREVFNELDNEEAKYSFLGSIQQIYSLPREYVERTITYYKKHDPKTAAFYAYLDRKDEWEYMELFEARSEKTIKKEARKQRQIEKRLKEAEREYYPLTEEEQRKSKEEYNSKELSIDEAVQLIDIYERRKDGWGAAKAAEIAQSLGLVDEGIKINVRRRWFKEAAKIEEEIGLLEQAMNDYDLDNEHDKAGQIALRIADEKRNRRGGLLRLLGSKEYNNEEKKYVVKAIEYLSRDSDWHDTALELAEQVLSLEKRIDLNIECRGPYDGVGYAIDRNAIDRALEICENHRFYDMGLYIATKTGNKKKAAVYKKIIALKEHGDDVYELEKAIERANKRTDEETMRYVEEELKTQARALGCSVPDEEEIEREAQEKHKKRRESGDNVVERCITYATKRFYEIRDAFVAEGMFEAIKFSCGVDTTGQLARKAAVAVLTATGLSSPYAMYQLYNAPQAEVAPSAYEIAAEPPKYEPARYEVQQKYEAAKVITKQAAQTQKMTRGCGQ